MSSDRVQWLTALIVFALAIPNTGVSAPTVVYDNTTTGVSGSWVPDGFWPFNVFAPNERMGDQITLAGTEREITEFVLVLSSSQPVMLTDLNLTLYENDGLDFGGFPGAPGTVLWTGTATNVAVSGTTTVAFSLPNVLVPDSFTWITRADSDFAGMATYDSPTVGSSGDYYWDRDSSDGEWYAMWFGSDPTANFGVQVTATPPSRHP